MYAGNGKFVERCKGVKVQRWNRIYAQNEVDTTRADPWLARYLELLEARREGIILELGCGSGQDARFLTERGFQVVATDFSEEALRITRQTAPKVNVQPLDLSEPFSFADEFFEVVIAGLSLHYFSWRKTLEIVQEVRRCLVPNGLLLARFNAVKGLARRNVGERLEENYYLVDGLPRRFFDEESLIALFSGWAVLEKAERTTFRYGLEKAVWEVAALKSKK